jgi:hypothetical protein
MAPRRDPTILDRLACWWDGWTPGRYRWRTSLRGRSPWWLINLGLASKGSHDCGAHDWYKQDGVTERCYHCEAGSQPVRAEWRAAQIDGLDSYRD